MTSLRSTGASSAEPSTSSKKPISPSVGAGTSVTAPSTGMSVGPTITRPPPIGIPQSYEWASVGGFAATRSSGQASAGYGRFDEMVLGLTLATPEGTLDTGRAPRSAAGPDLRQLILGSEGAFGVITSVTVRIRPVPQKRRYEGWRFASFEEGAAALRR